MTSELLRILIANVDKLSFVDAVTLLVIAASVLGSAVAVIHWIYKHAFEKQGEVIKSQDHLIQLKDKAIATYETRVQHLTEAKARAEKSFEQATSELSTVTKDMERLKAEGRQREAHLLLYAFTHKVGQLAARLIVARLEFCRNLATLVEIYRAVAQQHKDFSSVSADELLARVRETESIYLAHASTFDILDEVKIDGLNAVHDWGGRMLRLADVESLARRASALETYLIPNILPLLRKHEPHFASRVEQSYSRRNMSA
ncbi:MAG: hypothetical protein AB1452_06800 [Pseudomonadota bacterium]